MPLPGGFIETLLMANVGHRISNIPNFCLNVYLSDVHIVPLAWNVSFCSLSVIFLCPYVLCVSFIKNI